VLFLDDLQWADAGTISFMESFAKYSAPILLIGAYRDNEVTENHWLYPTLQRLQKQSAKQFVLHELSERSVQAYCAETLRTTVSKTHELGRLLHTKTGGNPFFLSQVLVALYQQRLFQFSQARWNWSLSAIEHVEITDNVVDFMTQQLQRTNKEVRDILTYGACLGAQFSSHVVNVVTSQEESDVQNCLHQAVREGFLLNQDGQQFKFVHDRIQQAAYGLLSEQERATLHYAIAKHMRDAHWQDVFELTSQWNRAESVVSNKDAGYMVSLNLQAGKQALESGAAQPAYNFAEIGLRWLKNEHVQERYSLEVLKIDALVVLSRFAEAKTILKSLRSQETDTFHLFPIYRRLVGIGMMEGDASVLDYSPDIFHLFGESITYNPEPSQVHEQLTVLLQKIQPLGWEQFLCMPSTVDPLFCAFSEVLINVATAAFMFRPLFLVSINVFYLEKSIELGTTPTLCFFLLANTIGMSSVLMDYQQAKVCANVGFQLAQQQNHLAARRSEFIFNYFALHFDPKVTPRDICRQLELLEPHLLRINDLEYGCYCRWLPYEILAVCDGISISLEKKLAKDESWFADIGASMVSNNALLWKQLFALLRQDDVRDLDLLHYPMLAIEVEKGWHPTQSSLTYSRYYLCQCILGVLFGKPQLMFEHFSTFAIHEGPLFGNPAEPIKNIVCGIQHLHPNGESAVVFRYQESLKRYAKINPSMWLVHHLWFEAEIHAYENRRAEAVVCFEQAYQAAEQSGALFLLACLCLRASEHLVGWKMRQAALGFAKKAAELFAEEWQSLAVLARIFEWFPELRVEDAPASDKQPTSRPLSDTTQPATPRSRTLMPSVPSLSSTHSSSLDFLSVVKASQAISSEIAMGKLIPQLLHVVCENAGASRGVFVQITDQKLYVVYERDGKHEWQGSEPIHDSARVPELLFLHTMHQRKPTVIDDTASHELAKTMEYYTTSHACSALCLPVEKGTHLLGFLYLENHVTKGVFTPKRLEVLNVLATQAAISLENANLIAEEEEMRRTAQEMEAAAAIQTSLVPRSPSVSRAEIATYMLPASKVGGDYFDVLSNEGSDWLFMGDVSGHGLAAGLVTMMCQTALHTALKDQTTTSPKAVLTRINQVLYHNLQQLKDSKYMTCVLLRRDSENTFTFSGLHLDLLVYRCATKQVERIATQGIWLGIVDSIEELLEEQQVTLASGDVLLLHTDGITEARHTQTQAWFSTDGLAEVLEQTGNHSAKHISEALAERMASYQNDDDISWLIFKQL
jgi:serine phosphatase RsbU (regulator of sigma subunit)/tetratricopeptide (TPR) repeat protein